MMTEPFKIKMQFLIGEIRNTGTRTVCAAIFVNSIKSLMCSGRNFSLGILNFQISIFSEEQFSLLFSYEWSLYFLFFLY